MKKFVMLLIMSMAFSVATSALSPAQAHHSGYYGDSSKAVAKHIGCKRFFRPDSSGGAGAYNKDSGVCWLKGKRVNVITFRGSAQQREWNAAARFGLPSGHWWANGKGAVVTAKNGNKPAARAGANALPGKLVKAY